MIDSKDCDSSEEFFKVDHSSFSKEFNGVFGISCLDLGPAHYIMNRKDRRKNLKKLRKNKELKGLK